MVVVVVGSRKISKFRVCVTQQWVVSKGISTKALLAAIERLL